jgi:hypothetical protein
LKPLHSIMTRVLVVEFYRINAGFFFLVIGLCFGFLSGREHMALAQAFVSSTTVLFIPFIVWIVYTLKVIQFNKLEFLKGENSFLYHCAALTKNQLWICCLNVAFKQLTLPFLYAVFLIAFALKLQEFDALVEIISALIVLAVVVAYRLRSEILHPGMNKKISALKQKIDSWFVRPSIWFYPEWILRQQPLLVIGTKIFSGLFIIGVSRLYLFDSYDERLMAMGCMLAFSSNLVLVYFYHRFDTIHFSLMRSLPIPLSTRLLSFIGTMTLLNITEIGLVLNYYPVQLSLYHCGEFLFFGLSIYVLAFATLYIKNIELEKFIQNIFIASFSWFILILFKMPVILLGVVQVLFAFMIYSKTYYTFEYKSDSNLTGKN